MSDKSQNIAISNTWNKNLHYWLFLLISFFPVDTSAKLSEINDTIINQNIERIRWVAEFPLETDSGKKGEVFSRIGAFFLGKKPPVISKPMAIIADEPGSFYVLDQESRLIIDVKDNKSEKPKAFNKIENNFPSLVATCLLPNGDLLFTDSSKGNIFLLTSDHKRILEFNENDTLQQPTGIAYSKINDQVWVLETAADKISIFNREGKFVRAIGKRGNANGEFNFPTHIWIDKDGLVYINDSMNFRVQIFDKEGNFVFVFGEIGDSSGYFARQKGIATDSYGNIYVVDALFNTIQIFNRQGEFLYNFGARGREAGDFWMPNGIYIDQDDYIYIADSYNARVQIFQLVNGEN
ncbi:MAG: 6-bladed beta-propeller [Cyclobacteriaceae bacterium]|nr:6-bladed beta-propeller [Cyclobacteriaceae bacterium]